MKAKIFVLIHKMDKVDDKKRNDKFLNRMKQFNSKAGNFKIECFPTSIWEASIYKTWSIILGNIIPNKDKIKSLLEKYCQACLADEVILFERNTFLYIFSYNNKKNKDNERFEKICERMKKFKNTCNIESKKYNHFLIRNKNNTIYLNEFENNTCIMTVLSNKSVTLELLKLNIEISKRNFKEIMDNY